MSPKEKVTATSSESTSTSNSSSSSSSSSSTSGSESSSSDSENSSSSQASAVKSNGSTDSDNRKPTKKKASPVKGKNVTSNEGESSKTKEKSQTKGRNSKITTSYSSEEDVPIKPPPKRKPPAKPKATATVTPITKPRQPTARAKATAAARANANKEKNAKSTANKQTESAAQKKLKTKSIFSPENSSESDDQGTQPPKLSPMKSTAKVVSHSKSKPKATSKVEPVPVQPSKAHSSATSTSGSSVSSESSSDSESSVDSNATAKPAKKKACTIKKISAATATTARARGETQVRSKAQTSTADAATTSATATASASAAASESEGERVKPVVTRKLTRSSSARRSKHLIGKTSDTESETEGKAKVAPAKKAAGPKGPAQRPKTKTRASGAIDTLQKPVEEERKCPLEGCNSLGHLSGKLEKHYTIDACPMYHNKTAQECKEAGGERKKHEDERRKAVASVNKKSPKAHLTVDQRHFQLKIKEMRSKHKLQPSDQEESSAADGKEREPKLTNLVPDYDLKLFQEAQAVASEKIEEDLKNLPHVKGTKYVEMGKFEMEVWYQSPYPEEYARVPKLYICEYCLRYMKSRTILKRHMVKCVWRHPPGEEVYRKEKISVWEVDGKRYKQYCQNLCLLAKFFLDHKTLYYDVEPFLFYVMTIGDVEGCHTVGYFSKEKNSFLNYNVSCILTLPPYQRQGYGRLLIDFSYLLTRVERKIGSPEKPLSDLGLISYRSYWKDVLLEYLCKFGGKEISIKDLSQEMAINSYDIVSTLQALGMMKYWKGKHIILKKQDVIEEYEERMKRRGNTYKEIDHAYLKWSPFAAPPSAGPP